VSGIARERVKRVLDEVAAEFGAMECHCACHRNSGIEHCMPCCHPCPVCGMRIAYGFEDHVKNHSRKGAA
jgi:hypothetical protein